MALTQAQWQAIYRVRSLVKYLDREDRDEVETTINLIFLVANKAGGDEPAHTNKLRFIADQCGTVDRADGKRVDDLLNLISLVVGSD